MPNANDLDTRIRDLIDSAASDAPAAPSFDELKQRTVAPTGVSAFPQRMRVLTAVAAAIALVAAFVALRPGDDDKKLQTSNTPDTTTPAEPPTSEPVIVTAGPDGVVEHIGNDSRMVTREPMVMVLATDTDEYIGQRQEGLLPVRIKADGSWEPLFDKRFDGRVRLDDFSVVDGKRILLYTVRTHDGDQMLAEQRLFAYDLDAKTRQDLGVTGGVEEGTGRLTLASTGLIVGTHYSEAPHSLFVKALPGSPADTNKPITPEDLGFEHSYFECDVCPSSWVIDDVGVTLYWVVSGNGENALYSQPLFSHDKAARVAKLPGAIDGIDVGRRGVVVNFGTDAAAAPVLVSTDGSDATTTLDGVVATVGPLG